MSVLACAGACAEWKGEERLGVTDVEISLLRWAFSALLQVTEKAIGRRGWFFFSLFFPSLPSSAEEMQRKAYFDCGPSDNQGFHA